MAEAARRTRPGGDRHQGRLRNGPRSKGALAWLIARPSITAPIASATKFSQLEELIAATRLDLGQSIKMLDAASA
ncbi:hypothetical protein [Phyllobacterium phragmitis]|uniref:hypothetical protein n=1 Tax=Phyllobacterium phragmitis TaxID=2670329 RepID=UPI001FE13288|nr:hypothetical protein [Phyllobacterium phragmitis]